MFGGAVADGLSGLKGLYTVPVGSEANDGASGTIRVGAVEEYGDSGASSGASSGGRAAEGGGEDENEGAGIAYTVSGEGSCVFGSKAIRSSGFTSVWARLM